MHAFDIIFIQFLIVNGDDCKIIQITECNGYRTVQQWTDAYVFWGFHGSNCSDPVSLVVTQCRLACGYKHFRGTQCFHLQGWSEYGEDVVGLYRQAEKTIALIYGRMKETEHNPENHKLNICMLRCIPSFFY